MTKALPSSTSELALLHRRLVAHAEDRGVPQMDAEDVASQAISKATLERARPGAPPLPVRARVALRDEIADYHRRRDARPRIDHGAEIPESNHSPDLDARRRLRLIARALRQELGEEVLRYAFMVAAGYSERQIAEQPGWDRLRAGRVRKRLERNGPKLLSELDHEEERREAS